MGSLTSIVAVLVEADEHMIGLQLLLSKLQQKSQTEQQGVRGEENN